MGSNLPHKIIQSSVGSDYKPLPCKRTHAVAHTHTHTHIYTHDNAHMNTNIKYLNINIDDGHTSTSEEKCT